MNEPMTEDRLDDLRRTPRQADVDDVADLVSEVDRLRADLDRAFAFLESCGVPRDRARTVANGIDVLATRFRRETSAVRASASATVERDAKRWRALRNCGRVRVMGSAFMSGGGPGGFAHIGLEFWTRHDAPSTPAAIAALDELAELAARGRRIEANERGVVDGPRCGTSVAEPGWECHRALDHDGPCAAFPIGSEPKL